jgi:membrane-bound metal-dependent hydrolase YbcI (DUF457 family)
MDLRFLALGAVLPDLIDLPTAIVWWDAFGSVRLAAHSITFGALVMVAVLVLTRRGPLRKRWMLLAVGVLLHLALDAMWQAPETLWWPFLGTAFTPSGFPTYAEYVRDLLGNPVLWAGEAVGLAYLVWLGRRVGIGDPEVRRSVLRTGVVSVGLD